MENIHTCDPFLELMDRPAFLVKDGIVVQANPAAQQKMIITGEPITRFITKDLDAYQDFRDGCLCLQLDLGASVFPANVIDLEDKHLFVLDEHTDLKLKTFSLVAQQLRLPLHSALMASEVLSDEQDSGLLNQSLSRLHRIICNMADIAKYQQGHSFMPESTDLNSLFSEIMEKAANLVSAAHIDLRYSALPQSLMGFADRQMIERAVLNLVSNAIKFSPAGSAIEAKLTRKGSMLHFTVHDGGRGIPPELRSSVFLRYLREPTIEECTYGLGLGLSLVHAVAVNHGGTVLIDYPNGGGTRVTMTIDLRPKDSSILRSPVRYPTVDYSGGFDHTLLELSDVLPTDMYNK